MICMLPDLSRFRISKVYAGRGVAVVLCFVFLYAAPFTCASWAYSYKSRSVYQKSIIDYRRRLNPRFPKIKRQKTRYIIVHTSECGLTSTLRTTSRGKRLRSGHRTYGGHAHYVIAKNGRTYRILDKKYRADHAGVSMWNGDTDISSLSIGIEIVGHNNKPITRKQYRAVGLLIDILKRIYKLDSRAVLTHSQVAYSPPNRWHRRKHRGRKSCAKNFCRAKAGLGPTWPYDPDVRAGRLAADPHLKKVFYAGKSQTTTKRPSYAGKSKTPSKKYAYIITKSNSPWSIAGINYNSPSTIYKLPDGRLLRGHQIASNVGWDKIQPQTIMLLAR
jgi:N-acetylmuramoyl-L-alanine amidase